MKIQINSLRNFPHPSLQIVNEWEDVFANILDASMILENRFFKNLVMCKIPKFYWLNTKSKVTFGFEMTASDDANYKNYSTYIPCIVDFWLTKEHQLKCFEKQHNNNKMVLISSKEAFDFLKSNGCKLNLAHLALSLPDKYGINENTHYNKQYDFTLVGRQNPKLMQWLLKYEKKHDDLYYVKEGEEKFHYFTNRGEDVGYIKTREDYIKLIRKARLALYSTPGMDSSRVDAQSFNQVTPKFLEYLAAGCHILSRYPKNSDTDYFELDRMSLKCNSYEDFEMFVDKLRVENVDIECYSHYLSKHYTSIRAKELMLLIENL